MVITLKILAALILLILIVGLINPRWVLFWMKSPDRLTLSSLCIIAFMATWTGIAKLTLVPKQTSAEHHQQRPDDDQRNALQLDTR
jgi:hypothetical protein